MIFFPGDVKSNLTQKEKRVQSYKNYIAFDSALSPSDVRGLWQQNDNAVWKCYCFVLLFRIVVKLNMMKQVIPIFHARIGLDNVFWITNQRRLHGGPKQKETIFQLITSRSEVAFCLNKNVTLLCLLW